MSEEKFKILVVDDEESLRGILKEVLVDAGFDVDCAADGKEALEKISRQKVDVVVTDIRMPEISGIELLEQIKKDNPEIQVIIMTSHASTETAIKAIRLGAYDYLTKPFEDLDIITTVINRTVERLKLEREVEHLLAMLQRRNQDVESLYRLTTEMATILKPEELIKKSVDALAQLCSTANVYYFVYQTESNTIQARLSSKPPAKDWGSLRFEVKGLKSISNYHKVINNDVELKKRMGLAEKANSLFITSLEISGSFVGCYVVVEDNNQEIDKGVKALVSQYIGTVSSQAEKAKLHETIRLMAVRDGLTGLFNHRYFQNALENEITRARRFAKPLSVVLFDIDNFKIYNDTNGHPAGDTLLRQIGKLLTGQKRSIDLVARYGGEEFVMILVETDLEGAKTLAERVRQAIEQYPFAHREKQPLGVVSVSMGISSFPNNADNRQGMIEAADQAMYNSKENGRNQVTVSDKVAVK